MRPVYIEYVDLCGPENPDWTRLHKINRKPALGKACGLLLSEDAENVTIILSALDAEPGKEKQRVGFGDFTFPRGCIRKMVDLVEAAPRSSTSAMTARRPRGA